LLGDYRQKGLVDKALVYELVDGGEVGQVIVLLTASSFADLGKTVGWPGDLLDLDHKNPARSIGAIIAETLRFRRDMSILP
jgi:hypothetical protein